MNRFQTNSVIIAMDATDELSEWEAGFIESLSNLPEDVELSEKQNEILNHIRKNLDFGI